MNSIFKKIDEVKYIQIVVPQEYLPVASALYTYILRLHKKVSLICTTKEINQKYSFLPWFDKIRKIESSSAEFNITLNHSMIEFYKYLKNNEISLNMKMATALYGALLDETKGFSNSKTDGTTFAIANELINAGAEYKICNTYILQQTTLARLRLKSLMLGNMKLENSAKDAVFHISENDFKATGTTMEDAQEIISEAFLLKYVEKSILFNSDTKEKFIISKEI